MGQYKWIGWIASVAVRLKGAHAYIHFVVGLGNNKQGFRLVLLLPH